MYYVIWMNVVFWHWLLPLLPCESLHYFFHYVHLHVILDTEQNTGGIEVNVPVRIVYLMIILESVVPNLALIFHLAIIVTLPNYSTLPHSTNINRMAAVQQYIFLSGPILANSRQFLIKTRVFMKFIRDVDNIRRRKIEKCNTIKYPVLQTGLSRKSLHHVFATSQIFNDASTSPDITIP